MVELFLAEGAKVAVFDVNKSNIKNDNVISVAGDVRDNTQLASFYKYVNTEFGKIDVLITCAGISIGGHVKNVTEDNYDNVMDINLKGTFFSVQKCLPYLNKTSSIILMASAAAHSAMLGQCIYAVSKSAIMQLARSLATDLAYKNIRVNSISPSFVDTAILNQLKENVEDVINKITETVPLGKRLATPRDIAKLALFLASDESSYITGEDFRIDGGATNAGITFKK